MVTAHEFTHTVVAAKVGSDPYKTRFEADVRARGLLAKRFGILSVDALSGHATLVREPDGMTIAVTGSFTAEVTQACVTTLEPVPDRIEEDFEGWYLDESQARSFKKAKKMRDNPHAEDFNAEEDEDFIASEQDDPEPVTGGMIDVGELVAQYLSLALNPYPRSEKALASAPVDEDAPPEAPSPFAVLKDLKGK